MTWNMYHVIFFCIVLQSVEVTVEKWPGHIIRFKPLMTFKIINLNCKQRNYSPHTQGHYNYYLKLLNIFIRKRLKNKQNKSMIHNSMPFSSVCVNLWNRLYKIFSLSNFSISLPLLYYKKKSWWLKYSNSIHSFYTDLLGSGISSISCLFVVLINIKSTIVKCYPI